MSVTSVVQPENCGRNRFLKPGTIKDTLLEVAFIVQKMFDLAENNIQWQNSVKPLTNLHCQ
jgi:hypothetical protein